jgi:hypothetical protein
MIGGASPYLDRPNLQVEDMIHQGTAVGRVQIDVAWSGLDSRQA